jgi:CRP/FNR family transcriptional regulator
MQKPPLFLFLAEGSFFRGLSESSRKALAEICVLRDLAKRGVLFREGAEGHAMYLLRRGHVQLHKAAPDGSEIVIKTVGPGEIFAEAVLFERDRYPVTATALTACELVLLPRRDVHRLLAHEDFRNDFIASLMRKQRYLAERIVQLTSHDVETRLLAFLEEQFGGAATVEVTLSKRDIAAAIGTTPETISRLIRRLQKRRVLSWKGRSLRWLGRVKGTVPP